MSDPAKAVSASKVSLPPLRLGIAGLGTVGTGLLTLLTQNKQIIEKNSGRSLEVVAVTARTKNKDRGIDLSPYLWVEKPQDLVNVPGIDMIIELMGGAEGDALALISAALEKKIPVVTANKALIAQHGKELAEISQRTGTPVLFEAAVAGAIPAVRQVKECAAADEIVEIGGILNGTCNFILSEMEKTGRDFEDVLKEAQEKGFAEADPSMDIHGTDAAHKLAILASIAFEPIDFDQVAVSGISEITAEDLAFADKLGYKVRLLGVAAKVEKRVEAAVQPCLVPKGKAFALIEGADNAVMIEGKFSGSLLLVGAGAGSHPTASAVAADVMAMAKIWPSLKAQTQHLAENPQESYRILSFWGGACATLPAEASSNMPEAVLTSAHPFYLRAVVEDKIGVLSKITAIFRDEGVSVHYVHQEERGQVAGRIQIALITHAVSFENILQASKKIEALDCVYGAPFLMRVLEKTQA